MKALFDTTYYSLSVIIIFLSVIGILVERIFQVRYDFISKINFPMMNFQICLICAQISFFLSLRKYIKRKRLKIIILLMLVTLFCATTINKYIYYSEEIDLLKENYFEQISLDKISSLLTSEECFNLYIGRADCQDCQEVFPFIREYAYHNQYKIYYYNTLADREYNSQYLSTILNQLHVNSVPVILVIKNGILEETFLYDEILREFSK